MIFSIGKTVVLVFKLEVFLIRYSQDQDNHIWANVPLGKSFDAFIPKKYYNEEQALNKVKVWFYELMLDAKVKKIYENN